MDRCEVCRNEYLTPSHKASKKHRFNYLLHEWTNYRKKLAKNRDGISISQNIETSALDSTSAVLDARKGKYTITLTSQKLASVNNKICFNITATNDRKEDVMYIMKATVLVPYEAFSISDKFQSCFQQTVMELKPKQSYSYEVQFKLPNTLIGSYKIPLALTFQQENDETVSFSIAREIEISISDFTANPEDKSQNPFKFDVWEDILLYIPPTASPPQVNNYPVPQNMHRIFMTGLYDNCSDPNEQYLLNFVKNCLCPDYQNTREFTGQYPTERNYKDFFHFLLWIDEVMQKLLLQRYNMSNVTMNAIAGDMLELEVPGLAEKRPSLITGDIVNIRFHEDHTVYKAIVTRINDKTIYISKMHPDLLEIVNENNEIELDVSFELNRLTYERMHKAIDVCIANDLLKVLFPNPELAKEKRTMNRFFIPDDRFLNRSILSNEEQKTAVMNILNCTSKHAPYIVYGPPGTGKTMTIVEAILQIKQHVVYSKILICAPANAACDMLAEKLIPYVKTSELIRIHTESRFWGDVPERIKPYSNRKGEQYTRITSKELDGYRIVIATLGLIGKYSGKYHPNYVFIDEAAQALEPDADIAVSMLSVGKQLILAGDPKQLGPQCASRLAAKHKLENSLLERLMDTNPLYRSGDNRFITMLKQNYRAHPQVLHIPNKLFYDGQLTAVSSKALQDPIARIFIHPLTLPKSDRKRRPGAPIEFCSVIAKEQREGKSPSYFNEPEIQIVMKYINTLLTLSDLDVKQHEIGVIAPYIRQVHRIKNRLKDKGCNDIEVGTTEAFQGREKRIMIISTVRGQNDLLLFDKKYNLGFVSHEKRMNVALTRAKSKLIVIGNPHVLGTDNNWEEYIKYCEENGAFFGAQYLRRTDAVRDDITNRFSGIKLSGGSNIQAANANNQNQKRRSKPKRAS